MLHPFNLESFARCGPSISLRIERKAARQEAQPSGKFVLCGHIDLNGAGSAGKDFGLVEREPQNLPVRNGGIQYHRGGGGCCACRGRSLGDRAGGREQQAGEADKST